MQNHCFCKLQHAFERLQGAFMTLQDISTRLNNASSQVKWGCKRILETHQAPQTTPTHPPDASETPQIVWKSTTRGKTLLKTTSKIRKRQFVYARDGVRHANRVLLAFLRTNLVQFLKYVFFQKNLVYRCRNRTLFLLRKICIRASFFQHPCRIKQESPIDTLAHIYIYITRILMRQCTS